MAFDFSLLYSVYIIILRFPLVTVDSATPYCSLIDNWNTVVSTHTRARTFSCTHGHTHAPLSHASTRRNLMRKQKSITYFMSPLRFLALLSPGESRALIIRWKVEAASCSKLRLTEIVPRLSLILKRPKTKSVKKTQGRLATRGWQCQIKHLFLHSIFLKNTPVSTSILNEEKAALEIFLSYFFTSTSLGKKKRETLVSYSR